MLRRICFPTFFPGDPDRDRLARLYYYYLGGIGLLIQVLLIAVGANTGFSPTLGLAVLALWAIVALLLYLARRGRVTLSVSAYLLFTLALATGSMYYSGGVRNPHFAANLILAILVAGTFLNIRAALLTTAVSLALIAWAALAELNGALPPARPAPQPLILLVDLAMLMISALVVMVFLRVTVTGALQRASQQLEERRELERLYRRAISAADAVPYSLDYHSNRYTFIGEGILKLTGYAPGEIDGATFKNLIERIEMRTDAPSPNPQEVGRLIQDGSVGEWKSDYYIHTRSGEQRWVSDASVQVYDNRSGPAPTGSIGLLFDISERKRAEAALSESEQRWRAVFERSAAGIAISDIHGAILEANHAFQRLTGYTESELCQMRFSDLSHPEDLPEELAQVERLVRGEIAFFQVEKRYIRKDGAVVWARLTASLIPDETGQAFYGLSIVDDITERKTAERTLRQVNEELEQRVLRRTAELEAANKELESFAYSVSHDLRAPLRAIDGYGRFLELDYAGQMDNEAQLLLSNIRQSTQKMSRLIDDLLKLSRMNRVEMTIQPTDLSQIAEAVVRSLRESDPFHPVEVRIAPDLPAKADPNLVQVALDNLLRNAWKFTRNNPAATIEFGVLPDSTPAVYYVRDNGAGFPMQYADKLFLPFQRLHASDEFEGTGVGLATVKRVIQRHGGRVWAESEPGSGATFYFTLG
ncbi:MAG: PAS domain S-box protein [Chloroflexota bacterium]